MSNLAGEMLFHSTAGGGDRSSPRRERVRRHPTATPPVIPVEPGGLRPRAGREGAQVAESDALSMTKR